jgi:hypothetical protein
MTEKTSGTVSPTLDDIEARIQQLTQAREALEAQRHRAREEELKVLADAFARKLKAAGFSVRQGIAALKPYARNWAAEPAPEAPAAPVQRAAAPSPEAHLRALAVQVLGQEHAQWMKRPHPLLGGQTPQDTAVTPHGREKVQALLTAYARGS